MQIRFFEVFVLLTVQVLQRSLPRPVSLTFGPEVKAGTDSQSLKEAAELMLYREMLSLLEHDAAKYPIKESRKDKRVRSVSCLVEPRSFKPGHSLPGLSLFPASWRLSCVVCQQIAGCLQKRERPLPAPAAVLETIPEDEKAAALAILKAELDYVRKAMGHESISAEEYAETVSGIERDFIFLPSRQRYERSASATNSDRLESIQVCV